MRFSRSIFVSLCFFSYVCSAYTATVNEPISFFSIKPLTCVVETMGDECKLQATIEWESTSSLDICINQDDTKLFCWANASSGKKVLPVSIKSTTSFSLVENATTLAVQKVKISAVTPVKLRRRLRSDWSIF